MQRPGKRAGVEAEVQTETEVGVLIKQFVEFRVNCEKTTRTCSVNADWDSYTNSYSYLDSDVNALHGSGSGWSTELGKLTF